MNLRKLLWALALVPTLLFAQPTNEQLRQMARTEATNQGVDPDALEARLQARGINTAALTMSDAPRIQPIIEEEIANLKAGTQPELVTQTAPKKPRVDSATLNKRIVNVQQLESFETEEVIKEKSNTTSTVFGKDLFKNGVITTFEVSKDYIPSDAYVLGPGDIVTVSIFGRSQADLQFTIKPDGFIEPTNLPKIYLKGISLGQAKRLVESRFKNFYQFEKGQFALTLTTARTLTVQITGAVGQPGTYTLSAYNTAFNALVAAGGPSKLGTVRNIQVINGRKVKTLDVYQYLFNPKNQKDYYLQNNDILYVPFTGNLIEVEGSVKQEGIFEMKDGENVDELLTYTGGYLSNALRDEVQLVRKDSQGSFVKEYKGKELSSVTFQDGDKVIIATQTSDRKDYVEVKGAVNYPGIYGIRDYGDLKALLVKVDLREETRMDVAYLIRSFNNGASTVMNFSPQDILNGGENLALQAEDIIQILNLRDFIDSSMVKVSGAIRDTGYYFIDSNLTVPTLVNLSNGLRTDAKTDIAYVFRTSPNGETEVVPVRLDDENFEFQDRDELRILSEKTFFDGAVLSISGEVKMPMEMPYDADITLAEVVELVGWLTFAGDSAQLIVYRMPFKGVNIGQLQEISLNLYTDTGFVFQPYDALVVRRKYGFEFQEFVTLEGEVVFPGRYAIRNGETVADLLRKAGGLTPNSFPEAAMFTRGDLLVSISLENILKARGSRTYKDIPLLPGDKIVIPKRDYTVAIRMANTEAENYGLFSDRYAGETMHVAYVAGKNARWYVKNMAGGFGENAKRSNTTVIYANGIARDYRFWTFSSKYPKVKPGSMIVVAAKPPKVAKEKGEKIDWIQFSQNLVAQATSVLTVWTLATRL
jgi:protein involved in polysaccharide export with SLBB domain